MATHPFPIADIARQAGVSAATVDRVLNGRGGVRASTVEQVRLAVTDLERQRTQFRLGGRTFHADVVMQAPRRFSDRVRAAIEAEVPGLRPAVVRVRFHLTEAGPPGAVADTLDAVARRGSHGVVLKAPDAPEIVEAVGRLVARGIPVVTLVTDLATSDRIAYVGVDNRAAGATAAYLVGQWLGDRPGCVLLTLSSSLFRGEEEREAGFRSVLRASFPQHRVVDLAHTEGLDDSLEGLVGALLAREPAIDAVYSIGGGNLGTIAAFDAAARRYRVFVAHDLDRDNALLLRRGRLSAVLHHDLRADGRRACQLIMQAHGALPDPPRTELAPVSIVTPYNAPAALTLLRST